MKKLFALLAVLALSTVAVAQLAVPYSNNVFSATFNGTVSSKPNVVHDTNTDYDYNSNDAVHYEDVTVRIITHDIPVNNQSSDFYADHAALNGWVIDTTVDATGNTSRSSGLYKGLYPYTYTYMTRTGDDGIQYATRTRWIVVNAREAVFIKMTSKAADSDHDYWEKFENSLEIK